MNIRFACASSLYFVRCGKLMNVGVPDIIIEDAEDEERSNNSLN